MLSGLQKLDRRQMPDALVWGCRGVVGSSRGGWQPPNLPQQREAAKSPGMKPGLVGDEAAVPGPPFLTPNHELQAAWQQPVGSAELSKASNLGTSHVPLRSTFLYLSEAFQKLHL